MSEQNIGTVVQITGPVLDIKFAADALPKLLNAITIDNNGHVITVEVAQHIGQDTVRCIAMESTDGLMRGMKATDTGGPITVPVGDKNLGRIFNLLGQPVDNKPAVEGEERWPIHRPAPSYEEQESTTEILETSPKQEYPLSFLAFLQTHPDPGCLHDVTAPLHPWHGRSSSHPKIRNVPRDCRPL